MVDDDSLLRGVSSDSVRSESDKSESSANTVGAPESGGGTGGRCWRTVSRESGEGEDSANLGDRGGGGDNEGDGTDGERDEGSGEALGKSRRVSREVARLAEVIKDSGRTLGQLGERLGRI